MGKQASIKSFFLKKKEKKEHIEGCGGEKEGGKANFLEKGKAFFSRRNRKGRWFVKKKKKDART